MGRIIRKTVGVAMGRVYRVRRRKRNIEGRIGRRG